jgi:hypothetical protein
MEKTDMPCVFALHGKIMDTLRRILSVLETIVVLHHGSRYKVANKRITWDKYFFDIQTWSNLPLPTSTIGLGCERDIVELLIMRDQFLNTRDEFEIWKLFFLILHRFPDMVI